MLGTSSWHRNHKSSRRPQISELADSFKYLHIYIKYVVNYIARNESRNWVLKVQRCELQIDRIEHPKAHVILNQLSRLPLFDAQSICAMFKDDRPPVQL